ncbi:MAG TPA: SDR family NAD(P)-dependent oxidoreductase [Polyangiales bacterium]|nr:SDR family NAD(P)-dependent oxidoreductase [Polyangiales bacterium]
MNLEGRTVLLTGGGTGIGRALARQLADKGNTVAVCGRRLDLLEGTASHSEAIFPYTCDLTSSEDITRLIDRITRDGHRIDTLISNAAILGFDSLAGGLDLGEAKQIIDANLFGPIELTQRMLDMLRRAKDPAIVIVGSPAGLGPLADTPIYSSSKAGLHAYTLCLRHHLDGEIRVIEVFPPTVDTPMLADKKWKKMSAEECARRMVRGIERGQEQVWIGESRMFRFLQLVLPPNRLFRVVNEWSPPKSE